MTEESRQPEQGESLRHCVYCQCHEPPHSQMMRISGNYHENVPYRNLTQFGFLIVVFWPFLSAALIVY